MEELAPEVVISRNQAWGRHRSEASDEPTASLDDLEWADGIALGTPTRRRLARVAQVIGVAREHGLLDVRARLLVALHASEL